MLLVPSSPFHCCTTSSSEEDLWEDQPVRAKHNGRVSVPGVFPQSHTHLPLSHSSRPKHVVGLYCGRNSQQKQKQWLFLLFLLVVCYQKVLTLSRPQRLWGFLMKETIQIEGADVRGFWLWHAWNYFYFLKWILFLVAVAQPRAEEPFCVELAFSHRWVFPGYTPGSSRCPKQLETQSCPEVCVCVL